MREKCIDTYADMGHREALHEAYHVRPSASHLLQGGNLSGLPPSLLALGWV
jgi:hypothetical protein